MKSKYYLIKIALLIVNICLFSFIASDITHAGYHPEDIGFYADTTPTPSNVPVYRFWSNSNGDHFYTISEAEKNILETTPAWGYQYEGIGFYADAASDISNTPVYRFYSNINRDHFYTTSEAEKNILETTPAWGYQYEGIGFYADVASSVSNSPVYRFYNTDSKDHFYTISELERSIVTNGNLGPDIAVGLWSDTKSGTQANPFKIKANKAYTIVDNNNNPIANIAADTITRVSYDADGNLRVFSSIPDALVNQKVSFRATDGNNADMIFDVFQPNSSFDQFRGRVSVRYSDTSKNIWMINILPLEQYVWGIGEITGTGDTDYNRSMVTTFRTYGLWKIYYSTKYATEGFTVDPTSGNQIYYGYDWETGHTSIKQAAQDTLGSVMRYGSDVALSPYSSWTDGRTRSFLERWGSSAYPWCQSVADPYGKNTTMSTSELEASGNHMVGISAHGALSLASDHNWNWRQILAYYLSNISIQTSY